MSKLAEPSPRTVDRAAAGAGWKIKASTALLAVGALVIGATVASTLTGIVLARKDEIQSTRRELANLTRALAEQTDRSVQVVDAVVSEVARDPLFARPDLPTDRRALFERLRQAIAGMPQVHEIYVIDARGTILYRSSEFPADPVSLADRDDFLAHRTASSTGLYFSRAFRDPSDDTWTVTLSHRMEDTRGRGHEFLGVVAATLDLGYFEHFYEAIDPGAGSVIGLYRTDGVLLARYPRDQAAVGRSFASLPFFRTLDRSVAAGPSSFRSPLDGEIKLFAAERVSDFPLAVLVGKSEAVVLASWREQTLRSATLKLLLCIGIALLIRLLMRTLRQREDAQERLRVSEERYALAMEGSNEGHWDWDLAARRVFLSSRLLALAGREGSDTVTDDDWAKRVGLVHPEDRARLRAALLDHLRGRTLQYECEYRVRDASGGYRWVLDRGVGLRNSRGRVHRMAGALTDITERKLADAERTRLEKRLRQAEKLEALGIMAGGIAHDFNNILGAILGYGDMVVSAAPASGALKRYAANVMTAANRAKNLVDQILMYSRSSSRGGKRGTVDLRRVADETVEMVRATLPPGIRLEMRLDLEDARVIGDATQLHQLLMNLCTNAIHAMPGGGTLTVSMDPHDNSSDGALSHGTLAPGRYVRLSVRDTGCGIPPEILGRIFEPFFTTKGSGTGTGLGLALVHSIVAELGGAVHVASQSATGSSFEVYLPRASALVERSAEGGPAPRGQGERVLLLDDERPLLVEAEEMVAVLGYEACGFHDAQEALDALTSDPSGFDVVIADQVMPAMTGTQFAARLRALGRDIPVLLLSGYRGALLEQEARAAGVAEILSKPIKSDDLARAIGRALTERSDARA